MHYWKDGVENCKNRNELVSEQAALFSHQVKQNIQKVRWKEDFWEINRSATVHQVSL